MLVAIEHFKKQLTKLEVKHKSKPPQMREYMGSIKSLKYIDLSSCLSPQIIQVSPIIPLHKPHKQVLPPLDITKKVSFIKDSDIQCISNRIDINIQRISKEKTLKLSRSHKIQEIISSQDNNESKETQRKPILLNNIYEFDRNSIDSSPTPILDPLLENNQ